MPSSNKTTHLQLNKWIGADKPKKDDFNSDNQKVDEACRLLQQSITLLQQSTALLDQNMKSGDTANAQAITALSSSLTASLTNSFTSSLSSHTGNATVHVTQSEKTAWTNKSGAAVGTYTGDGKATKKITLGYQPMFVLVFPVGDGITRANWTSQSLALNSGCVSNLGSSLGMTVNSDGFTVEYYSTGGMDGFQIKYNANGVKYIYIAFKQ